MMKNRRLVISLFVVRGSRFKRLAEDEQRAAVLYAHCLPRLFFRHQRRHVSGRAGGCRSVSEVAGGTVAALDVGARLEISRVMRGGMAATKVDVYAHGEKDLPREVFWEQQKRWTSRIRMRTMIRLATLTGHVHPPHGHPTPGPSPEDGHAHGRGLTEIRADHREGSDQRYGKGDRDPHFRSAGRGRSRDSQYDCRESPFSRSRRGRCHGGYRLRGRRRRGARGRRMGVLAAQRRRRNRQVRPRNAARSRSRDAEAARGMRPCIPRGRRSNWSRRPARPS